MSSRDLARLLGPSGWMQFNVVSQAVVRPWLDLVGKMETVQCSGRAGEGGQRGVWGSYLGSSLQVTSRQFRYGTSL